MTGKDWRPTAFVETAPGVVTESDAEASRLELRRSLRAFVHRLVALDAVSLVLTVTLVGRAFAQPVRRELAAVSVGAFLLGIAIGGIATLALAARTPRVGARRPPSDGRPWIAVAVAAFVAFLVGVAALAGFFLANWFR